MLSPSRGRPPASSREALADAACELFFEQGYEATTTAEIARRAGVSRSSFFNYFAAKDEILWFGFDARAERLCGDLADPGTPLEQALAAFGAGAAPDTLALAIAEARTMRVEEELFTGRAVRQLRIADAIRDRLVRDGASRERAEILAAGYSGALVGAVWRWAELGAGRHRVDEVMAEALRVAHDAMR